MTDRRSTTTQPFLRLLRNSQVARLRPRQLIAGRQRRRYPNSTPKTDFPLHNTVTLWNGRDSANDIAIKLICFHAARWRHRIMLKLKIRSNLGFSPPQSLQDEPIQVEFGTKEHTRISNLSLISEERWIQELRSPNILDNWSNVQFFGSQGRQHTSIKVKFGMVKCHGSTFSCKIWP